MTRLARVSSVALVAAVATATGANAIYSTSFEAPNYGLGTVAGQDGWVNGSGAGATQTVSTNLPLTGAQSLYWDNSNLQSFYSVRHAFDGQNGAISAATPLEISIWMIIDANPNRLYGIYAMNSSASTMGGTNLGVTVSGDGTVRAGTAWSQTYSGPGLVTDPAFVSGWIRVALTYDGVGGGAAIYDDNNALLWSTTFAAVNLANANGNGTQWGVNLGTDYFATTDRLGIAYMDDLNIRLIPTPGAAAMLGLAGLVGIRRRRA